VHQLMHPTVQGTRSMPSLIRQPVIRRLRCMALFASLLLPIATFASQAGDALRQLNAALPLTRSITLADLGITTPLVLAGDDASRDFYLPVPKGLALNDASIVVDGKYLKGATGDTHLVLSVDGVPLSALRIGDGDGLVAQTLAIDAQARDTGFVRLGVNWYSRTGLNRCENDHSIANSVSLSPQTGLTYHLDSRAVATLDDAWSTLPGNPVVLIAGGAFGKDSFDSTWRIGVALQRNGKRVSVHALPAIGATVDTRGLAMPAALAQLPAFAALGNLAQHRLANAAELGALLVLNAAPVSGDVVIADAALRDQLHRALDALRSQLVGDPDALAAFDDWCSQREPLATATPASKEIRLAAQGRQTVIAIAADAGASAAGVFDTSLHHILTSPQVLVPTATSPELEEGHVVHLSSLGGTAEGFDVVARGDWTANFPLNAVSSAGRMPGELVLYLAAAPGASSTRPVATVFWNGFLLAAKQLQADGHPEELKTRLPAYVLRVNNTLRVSVQRQTYSANCNEVPQGYPVNVLPAASYVKPGDAEPDGTFVSLLPLMAGNPQLIVPDGYLSNAADSIRQIIGIASASGLSPTRAELTLAAAGQPVKPTKPFVAMEVTIDGPAPSVKVVDHGRLQIDGKLAPWLDIAGLQRLAAVEVVRAGGQDGLLWYALGNQGTQSSDTDTPFLLNRGNVAIIGPAGPVAWIDSDNPHANLPPGADHGAFYEWRRYISWGAPIASLALLMFIVLLIVANYRNRKNRKKH